MDQFKLPKPDEALSIGQFQFREELGISVLESQENLVSSGAAVRRRVLLREHKGTSQGRRGFLEKSGNAFHQTSQALGSEVFSNATTM